MSFVPGTGGAVSIGSAIATAKEWGLDLQGDAIDTTNFSSGAWRTKIGGLKGGSGTVKINLDDSNIAPVNPSANIGFNLQTESGKGYSGNAVVTGVKTALPVEGILTQELTFDTSGPVNTYGY
jgi:hypothetical protein